MIDQNEHDLISRIRSGDHHLYSVLVNRYQDFAFNVALSIVNDREDAEEIAHDGFLKAFKGLESFNGDSKFSTWLYSIIYHTAISFTRKKKYVRAPLKSVENLGSTQVLQVETDERTKYINLALDDLGKDDREVLQLFYLKEMSLEEMSQITGSSVNTLKVRLHRARKKMAVKMKLILNQEALNL